MRVVITAPAEADLEEVFDYIALENPRAAKKYVAELRRKIRGLGQFPRAHPLRNDLRPGFRTVAHGSHLIVFRIAGNLVEIVGVVHGARDLPSLFES
jgi:toxin ParE1/3/4